MLMLQTWTMKSDFWIYCWTKSQGHFGFKASASDYTTTKFTPHNKQIPELIFVYALWSLQFQNTCVPSGRSAQNRILSVSKSGLSLISYGNIYQHVKFKSALETQDLQGEALHQLPAPKRQLTKRKLLEATFLEQLSHMFSSLAYQKFQQGTVAVSSLHEIFFQPENIYKNNSLPRITCNG